MVIGAIIGYGQGSLGHSNYLLQIVPSNIVVKCIRTPTFDEQT